MKKEQRTKLIKDLLQFLKVGLITYSCLVLFVSWLIHITK